MKFFVDTADMAEIKELAATGLLDGVTTNPSLIAKAGAISRRSSPRSAGRPGPGQRRSGRHRYRRHDGRGREARQDRQERHGQGAADLGRAEGLPRAGRRGHQVNVTLCFSANQALLAAKAGATFISPFIGRLDDIGPDGMDLIREIRAIYDNYDFETEILAASIRNAAACEAGGPDRRRCRDRAAGGAAAWSSTRSPTKVWSCSWRTGRRPASGSSERRAFRVSHAARRARSLHDALECLRLHT